MAHHGMRCRWASAALFVRVGNGEKCYSAVHWRTPASCAALPSHSSASSGLRRTIIVAATCLFWTANPLLSAGTWLVRPHLASAVFV